MVREKNLSAIRVVAKHNFVINVVPVAKISLARILFTIQIISTIRAEWLEKVGYFFSL